MLEQPHQKLYPVQELTGQEVQKHFEIQIQVLTRIYTIPNIAI